MPLTGPGTNSFPGNGVIIIDETPIVGGTDGYVLYDNNGVVGVEAGGGGGTITEGTTPTSGFTDGYAITSSGGFVGQAQIRTILTGNLNLYVNASTGSDSYNGLSATFTGGVNGPFKTIGKAISTAVLPDYNFLYFPTVAATGSFNEQNTLPALINCTNGGVINFTAATVTDLGTAYTFTCGPFSVWTVGGVSAVSDFSMPGTFGAFSLDFNAALTGSGFVDFSGNYSNFAVNLSAENTQFVFAGMGIHISSSMDAFLFTRGVAILAASTITFPNAITLSGADGQFVSADASSGFIGFEDTAFVNGTNLTAAFAIDLSNGAFLETANATVDSNPITYANFPGYSAGNYVIDQWSRSELDALYRVDVPTTGGTVSMAIRQQREVLNPAGTLATLTVNLPPYPQDGDVAGISTTQIITALTIATTDGNTLIGAPSTLAASQIFSMVFDATTSIWYP